LLIAAAYFSAVLFHSNVRRSFVVSGSGKIPLWIVATVAGMGVIVVVGLFFYGAYAGVGSSL
jgi:photosystem II PsbJ protein